MVPTCGACLWCLLVVPACGAYLTYLCNQNHTISCFKQRLVYLHGLSFYENLILGDVNFILGNVSIFCTNSGARFDPR